MRFNIFLYVCGLYSSFSVGLSVFYCFTRFLYVICKEIICWLYVFQLYCFSLWLIPLVGFSGCCQDTCGRSSWLVFPISVWVLDPEYGFPCSRPVVIFLSAKNGRVDSEDRRSRHCPYLDTINRSVGPGCLCRKFFGMHIEQHLKNFYPFWSFLPRKLCF